MDNYLYCKCGGLIGSYNRGDYCICERCKEVYPFHKLNYDFIVINEKTGWLFPLIKKN